MKNIITLFLLVIHFACSKDANVINKQSLAGLWTLTQVSGGIAGSVPMPAGKNTIGFEASGKYTKAVDDVEEESGFYTISLKKTIFSEQLMNVISFMPSQGNSYEMVVELNGKHLSLNRNAYDGINYDYSR